MFKYVGPERIDILNELRIRFTQPSCCNDPFESQLCIDGLEDEVLVGSRLEVSAFRRYEAHVHSEGAKPRSFEEFRKLFEPEREQVLERLRKDRHDVRKRAAERVKDFWGFGILSLTTTKKNLLMWAHYTESHKGMLIELDPKHPFFKPPNAANHIEFGTLAKVVYSEKRPRHKIGEFPTAADFCVKSLDWEYEHEWRVFQLLEKSDQKLQTGNGVIYLFNLPPESIKGVVMGCRMEKNKRKVLIDVIRSNRSLENVDIREAALDLDAFSLTYSAMGL
jgi:hypothetical protein